MKLTKQEDGWFLDEEGISWQDETTYLLHTHFDFCGCGMPEDCLVYIGKVLQHIENLATLVGDNKQSYSEWEAQGKILMPASGAEYLVYYVLDKAELTEHGGSVPGWLTPKGAELLKDIRGLFPDKFTEPPPPQSPDSPPVAAPPPGADSPHKHA